ncbi:hypothetical protein [Schaalia suimastitidis]|uniref:hypothetical protein n=1 Tax=Schaalia suimastitidis TaxID=121163 RepID=UPI00103A2E33|nr:hypothetical protein [Schaalia suimastitidis]
MNDTQLLPTENTDADNAATPNTAAPTVTTTDTNATAPAETATATAIDTDTAAPAPTSTSTSTSDLPLPSDLASVSDAHEHLPTSPNNDRTFTATGGHASTTGTDAPGGADTDTSTIPAPSQHIRGGTSADDATAPATPLPAPNTGTERLVASRPEAEARGVRMGQMLWAVLVILLGLVLVALAFIQHIDMPLVLISSVAVLGIGLIVAALFVGARHKR